MQYGQQVQDALDRLDASLAKLRYLVKRGENGNALHFMEHGELKERFEELQSMITISQSGNIGARGTTQTGTF